jgi:hypothetical protein
MDAVKFLSQKNAYKKLGISLFKFIKYAFKKHAVTTKPKPNKTRNIFKNFN